MDKLEPIRRVFREAGLYNHAADDLLCQRLAELGLTQAEPVAWPDYEVAHTGFRFDAVNQCHYPLLHIEFSPVPVGKGNDEKGWRDRNWLAEFLTSPEMRATYAAPQPQPSPQASAEDVAMVDKEFQDADGNFYADEDAAEAWQRIRASLGVGK